MNDDTVMRRETYEQMVHMFLENKVYEIHFNHISSKGIPLHRETAFLYNNDNNYNLIESFLSFQSCIWNNWTYFRLCYHSATTNIVCLTGHLDHSIGAWTLSFVLKTISSAHKTPPAILN